MILTIFCVMAIYMGMREFCMPMNHPVSRIVPAWRVHPDADVEIKRCHLFDLVCRMNQQECALSDEDLQCYEAGRDSQPYADGAH
mgnify:CR=1 FL=1